MRSSLRLFRSVKFNIGLVFAIAASSAIGTLLPQVSEAPEKVDAWMAGHPVWGKLFEGLGFFHLYESWWYLAMLGLLAFDIVVCKLMKAPPDAGLVALPPELETERAGRELDRAEAAIAAKPFQAEFVVAGDPEETAARLRDTLSAERYHVHASAEVSAGGRSSLVATRHRLQRWGSYIAHVALVVILAGGLLKQLYGFVEMVPVLEGGSRAMQHKPGWELHVHDFTVKYYDGTQTPKLFSSDLEVTDGDKVLARKTIKVNEPLDIGGVRFYQASWGAGGMFRSVTLKLMSGREVQMPQRTPIPIPGTGIRVTADLMLPNFAASPDGTADSASLDMKNPAVRFRFLIGGRATRPLWMMVNRPGVAFSEDENGVLMHAPTPPFTLSAIDPVLFSGIQVAYDPGFKVVLAGGIGWLVGMILLFYMHRRRLWLVVGPDGEAGRTRVRVGAWSSRGSRDFRREFDALVQRLSRELGGPVAPAPLEASAAAPQPRSEPLWN